MLAPKVAWWQLPSSLNPFQAYGLWNCLLAYDTHDNLLAIIPAHDGDFFPETPFDYVERMRRTPQEYIWPLRVDIDITQVCTDRCFFCYSRPYSQKNCYNQARMPLAEFDHLLDELARHGTQTVRFTGGGEPLEHPNIREMLVLPHRYGLKTCLITNGSLLDDELDELLVQSVDHIRLSVNAGTEETRRAIHRSTIADAGLSKLHTHLHKLSILRARYFPRERHPSIWATFLILPQNLSEIARAAEDVARCGADSISFRPVYHDMYARLDPLDQQNLAKQLEAARAFHNPPRFQVFTPRRDLLTAGMLVPSDYFDQCLSCHLRTVIEAASPNRLIKVCGLYRGEEDGLLAELANQFEVAWFSTQAEVERHSHPECCETCIDVSMNVTLAAIRRVLDQVPDAVFRRGWQRQV